MTDIAPFRTARPAAPGVPASPLRQAALLLASLALASGLFVPQALRADPVQLSSAKPESTATASPASVAAEVITVPGDFPLPAAGQQVVIPVPAGATVRLQSFDAEQYEVTVKNLDLLLSRTDGGVLVLQDFLKGIERNPNFLELNGVAIAASTLAAQVLAVAGDPTDLPETAAEGFGAQGGGEVFSLVPVITWLLESIDVFPSAQAAQGAPDGGPPDALLAQVQAQFRIAREVENIKAAEDYRDTVSVIAEFVEEMVAAGRGALVDATQARAAQIEAQLEVKDAAFRHTLAVIGHQDAFGDWLETARFLDWQDTPSDDIDAIRALVGETRQAEALRHWRQRQYALETGSLLETLNGLASEIRDAYREQFDVGQRTLGDLLGAERAYFQTRVRQAQRRYDLKSAEAWILAAEGKLLPRYRQQPGSQP